MTSVKEYTESKIKELQKLAAKDVVVNVESAKTQPSNEDRELTSRFYKALATGDRNEISAVNSMVEKQYKAKAQSVGTIGSGTAGGVLVPTTVADSIISKMVYISPIRQLATVISDMPAQLQLPSESALATAYWVAEGAPITESGETLAPNLLTPYKLAGLDSFTSEVLADAATNPSIQDWVESRFAIALALLENGAFVNGTGSGQPWGFRSSQITPASVAQAGATVAYGDVTKLMYTLGTAYRSQAVFVTSSAGVQALVNVKDNYGRPIWRDGLSTDNPPTLMGRPIYVVDEIPANLGTGTNATELWFGVFKNYYIGDRGTLSVDYGTQGTDFAADKISLRVTKRVAGIPVLSESFAKLTGVISA